MRAGFSLRTGNRTAERGRTAPRFPDLAHLIFERATPVINELQQNAQERVDPGIRDRDVADEALVVDKQISVLSRLHHARADVRRAGDRLGVSVTRLDAIAPF